MNKSYIESINYIAENGRPYLVDIEKRMREEEKEAKASSNLFAYGPYNSLDSEQIRLIALMKLPEDLQSDRITVSFTFSDLQDIVRVERDVFTFNNKQNEKN